MGSVSACRRAVQGGIVVVALTIVVLFSARLARSAADIKGTDKPLLDVPHRAVVHVYGEKLVAGDKLTDGPDGRPIRIMGEATLVWVDLAPDARYAHETEYLLITPRGTSVSKGQWWPVLNGKPILRGEKPAEVRFPIELNEAPERKPAAAGERGQQ
jgi:hypothetical protein